MSDSRPHVTNPKMLAEQGEQIYRERYQRDYEQRYPGKYVAIEVKTGEAYVGDSPEETFQLARQAVPGGLFHLIRIGYPGVFRVSHVSAHPNWIF